MNSSTQQRERIEDLLKLRIPAALTPRQREEPERISCKSADVDEFLKGGLAVGSLTEFVGQHGSGRTTAALAYVRAVTDAGGVCAWIDAADALDPESAAANGVALERLLWVRCGSPLQAVPQRPGADQLVPGPACLSLNQQRNTGGESPPHAPEEREMPQAISALRYAHGGLHNKQARRERRAIGTPGAPNRPLAYRSENRKEQVNSDRLPPRRGDNLSIAPRCAEPQLRRVASVSTNEQVSSHSSSLPPNQFRTETSPWKALDQALRATDLLLQGGGFTVIVLDLANVPPEFAVRVPLATWFRFRAACERTRVSLLLLTQHPCARSSAEAVVCMQLGSMEAEGNVMTGILYQAATERSRAYEFRVIPIRKPPQSERIGDKAVGQWASDAAWMEAG